MNAIAFNPPNRLPQNGRGVAADYHARDKTLVTREEFHAEIAGVRAEMSEIRKDIRTLYRLLVIAVLGGAGAIVALIGGQIALIAKLYFGA